ncbi:related to Endo-1,4-beta-xylanase xynf11a [Rhynchosporium agropyri]|uniref:Endo-1,4-beta-xylanase n=2 Tax=Rhynchosporium TaxID=38037 RepID=A0A1E1KSC5_9HELO|nr:related to Endo-1,4-beta-xylanase xynf11a [Rhynchosporium commune]CZT00900.1 related to Endo-1,4-beta-xylanase xynf11a [Rhynchosporium agropyri]
MLFNFFKSLLLTAALAKAISLDEEVFGRSFDLGSKLHRRDANASLPSDKQGTGYHDGYFYSFWWDGMGGNVTYHNLDKGSFSVTWNNTHNFVAGKGWNPGSRKTIVYNGTWNAINVNSYVACYGWFVFPLAEYYVVEAYGEYKPSAGTASKGTVETDGGIYDIYQTERYNMPSINGTATFSQYWSIRQTKRVGGEITIGNHIDAWAKSGLDLGTQNLQIMAVEGYRSSGSAYITVSEKGVDGVPYPNRTNSH